MNGMTFSPRQAWPSLNSFTPFAITSFSRTLIEVAHSRATCLTESKTLFVKIPTFAPFLLFEAYTSYTAVELRPKQAFILSFAATLKNSIVSLCLFPTVVSSVEPLPQLHLARNVFPVGLPIIIA